MLQQRIQQCRESLDLSWIDFSDEQINDGEAEQNQWDAEVAAQCRDARDFYGCVRAFTTPVRGSDDTPPFDGVMGQVAAGLISGTSYRNAPQNFPRGTNPAGLVERILQGVLR